MNIALSINDTYKGKLPPMDRKDTDSVALWRRFTTSFKNALISPNQLMQEIHAGHAYAAQLKNGYRRKENFSRSQVISVDLDTGDYRSSFDFLDEMEFIRKYAYFAYTTPSHTKSAPRSRVVFVLSTPVSSPNAYRWMTESVIDRVPQSDDVCKDPARLFYGSPWCDFKIWHNVVPTVLLAKAITEPFYLKKQKDLEAKRNRMLETASDIDVNEYVQTVLSFVLKADEGRKAYELNRAAFMLGGIVGTGLMDEDMAFSLLLDEISKRDIKSLAQAKQIIDSGLSSGMRNPTTPTVSNTGILKANFKELFV